jgi:cyanate permease
MLVRARWPWPLLLMLIIGITAAVTGVRLMSAADWRGAIGLLLFFGGVGLSLFAPLLWRDAKRESASGELRSRPVV